MKHLDCWTLLSGAGNKFYFFDKTLKFAPNYSEPELHAARDMVCRLCSGYYGDSADGCVLVYKGQGDCDFEWVFYNRDGSLAEMCGNAARCLDYYVRRFIQNPIHKSEIQFLTLAGKIKTQLLPSNLIKVDMPYWIVRQKEIKLAAQDFSLDELTKKTLGIEKHLELDFINSGVPHGVIWVDRLDVHQLVSLSVKLRQHEIFGQDGANITWVERGTLRAQTFERGVEGFTEACGTGAVAACISNFLRHQKESAQILMPGGALQVDLDSKNFKAQLTGEAHFLLHKNFLKSENNKHSEGRRLRWK